MADPATPRGRPIWRIVLVLSLALNIAVVGMVAGFAWRGGTHGPPRGVELALGPIGQALAPGDRRAISKDLRGNLNLRGPRGQGRGPQFDAMIEVLRTTPFDGAAFADTLDVSQARQQQVRDAVRTALVNRIAAMSDADRAAFADRLAQATARKR